MESSEAGGASSLLSNDWPDEDRIDAARGVVSRRSFLHDLVDRLLASPQRRANAAKERW